MTSMERRAIDFVEEFGEVSVDDLAAAFLAVRREALEECLAIIEDARTEAGRVQEIVCEELLERVRKLKETK